VILDWKNTTARRERKGARGRAGAAAAAGEPRQRRAGRGGQHCAPRRRRQPTDLGRADAARGGMPSAHGEQGIFPFSPFAKCENIPRCKSLFTCRGVPLLKKYTCAGARRKNRVMQRRSAEELSRLHSRPRLYGFRTRDFMDH
jgi:hypothetical protein